MFDAWHTYTPNQCLYLIDGLANSCYVIFEIVQENDFKVWTVPLTIQDN